MRKLLLLLVFAVALGVVVGKTDRAVAGDDWTSKVEVNGDLRYRHEMIDDDAKDDTRTRHRVRARIGIDAKLDDELSLGFRLASGSDDPVSTNQTLDGSFTSKNIVLDRAFFAWAPVETGLKITGGKMGNPFYKPAKGALIWDGDLNPEGMAATWKNKNGETSFWATAAGFFVDERSGDKNAALFGGQAGLKYDMDASSFTVGASYYTYSELQGALYDDDFFGNTADGDMFMYDYDLLEAFAEFSFEAGEMPIKLYGDYVSNSDPDENNTGFLFGFELNKAKKPGSWKLAYDYREIEADAVMAAYSDSDFGGGGTDAKGHRFAGAYQVSKAAQLAATLFVNEKGIKDGDEGVDYTRLQVDMKFKF